MNKIWEFYENMDEMVYAADMDTYELIYMNAKARETYGYDSMEQVCGQKCYKVLQNADKLCDICTNSCLKPGYFHEWKYYNPLINKTVSLKDTMIEDGNKRYRMEMAIDMTFQEEQSRTLEDYRFNAQMVNEGLKQALAEVNPEQSIEVLLDYLGRTLQSERVYIFEKCDGDLHDNTYEWCADGVVPQKEILQKVPFDAVEQWYQAFVEDKNIIIRDLEETKETNPKAYQVLLPQNIRTLVVSPIVFDEEIVGFYGVDNPPKEFLNHVSTMFKIMGHFISSLLRRRDLVKRLEKISFYDRLTGLKNRHAMDDYFNNMKKEDSIGILYCDVMGLKRVNDTLGHQEGDKLLLRACDSLKKAFEADNLFRIGGDEFLVLCKEISEQELQERTDILKAEMHKNNAVMAIGSLWQSKWTGDGDKLLTQADHKMYEDKRKYYEEQK